MVRIIFLLCNRKTLIDFYNVRSRLRLRLHYGKFFCMFTICLYNFCVYRLPAGTNLQYFCISVNQILTNDFVIQTQYFCKSAHNICNQNSFLQFKCKRIANLSQNHFQTFCDEVQIYCTLVQSKCNWYFLPLINCKKIAIFTHFESAKMSQFTAKKEWIKRMLESKLS